MSTSGCPTWFQHSVSSRPSACGSMSDPGPMSTRRRFLDTTPLASIVCTYLRPLMSMYVWPALAAHAVTTVSGDRLPARTPASNPLPVDPNCKSMMILPLGIWHLLTHLVVVVVEIGPACAAVADAPHVHV